MFNGKHEIFVNWIENSLKLKYDECVYDCFKTRQNAEKKTIIFDTEKLNKFEAQVIVCVNLHKFEFYLIAEFDLNILFNTEDEEELENLYDNKFNDLSFLSELFKKNFDKFRYDIP
jgi:hypothetical protein